MIGAPALLALTALVAGQSVSGDGSGLAPAPQAAILAGGKACVGATVDPAGQGGRLTGWTDATAAQTAGMHTDGRVVTRDNVTLVVKPGVDGGCVVQARADAAFDKAKFLADLSAVAGVAIDGSQPKVDLPNGELMVVQVGADNGATFVQLVVANPNGKYVKHSKGN